jgi:hypothetical protein
MSIAVWLGSQFMMAPVAGRGGSIFQSGMSGGSGYVDADVADAILESAATGAATPLDAVVAGSLSGEMLMRLIAPNGTTAGIGELTQSDILLGAGRQSVMDESARLAKRLPPNNAPYRIGCAVFCHRDLPSDDEADIGANWVVVVTPRTVGEMVHVVTRDGSHDVPLANFEAALAVEQARRARLNVPPLPDPFTIPDVYTGLISPQPKPGIPSTESRPASPPSDPGSEPSSEPGSDPEPGPDS